MMNPDPGGEVGVVKRVLFEKVTVVNSQKIASLTQYPSPKTLLEVAAILK